MEETRAEVMWPKLVPQKLLRRCKSSSRFVADITSIEDKKKPTGLQRSTRKYKLYVSTWNVGGIAPPDNLNLEDWLDTCNNPCDIYVLGFQEIVPLRAGNVLGMEKASKVPTKWNSLIRAALNKTRPTMEVDKKNQLELRTASEKQKVYPYYKDGSSDLTSNINTPSDHFKCIISKQIVGIFISVWVRGDLRRFVRHPSVVSMGCGIMGFLGNKGSVSVRFYLHETSFCFVCSHLASGGKDGDEVHRNADATAILSRTSFPRGSSLDFPIEILDHERVVWLGDLNYRISMPDITTRLLVEKGCWDQLLKNDQLKVELSEGGVFEGWQEGTIDFAPTYKYNPNSDKYYGGGAVKAGQKRRAPGWCDRIIWYGKGLEQVGYTRGESRLSDHRPVKAVYSVDVEEMWSLKALATFFELEKFEDVGLVLAESEAEAVAVQAVRVWGPL